MKVVKFIRMIEHKKDDFTFIYQVVENVRLRVWYDEYSPQEKNDKGQQIYEWDNDVCGCSLDSLDVVLADYKKSEFFKKRPLDI